MSEPEVGTWLVGFDEPPRGGAGAVVFSTEQQRRALDAGLRPVVPFHSAAAGPPPRRARQVVITPPTYRGMSFYRLLSWLVASRLAGPGAVATWRLDRQQGPKSVLALLEALGWSLELARRGRTSALTGSPPERPEEPTPRRFRAALGRWSFDFEADYGVFSPGRIDDGTALLVDVALAGPRVESVADVGTGYGSVGLALLGNGLAAGALGADVDSVALWLAERNARRAGLALETVFEEDPVRLPAAPLTVCNMPTHLAAPASQRLARALAQRARRGLVLVVVHASLEARYAEPFAEARTGVTRHPGRSHVVLRAGHS